MFRIKICGLTNAKDARMVASSGADAIGLNFYPKSVRYVDSETAQVILQSLPKNVRSIGLFVNAEPSEIRHTFDSLKLAAIQLHGDEPPELLAELGDRPVIRAFRVGPPGLRPVVEYVDRCKSLHCPPKMVLLDSYKKGEYGGTGNTPEWSDVKQYHETSIRIPMVLAGGLTPQNVRQAIQATNPDAVDTASGVESSPGQKEKALVDLFVSAARLGLDSV